MVYENKNINVANFFWGGDLTNYEISNFLSFKENGFDVNIWSYEELDLPDGINLRDASQIIEKNLLNKFKQNFQKSNMSSFSNLFRYELIKQQQGWWFDSDCICIESVDKFVELASDEPFILGLENTNLVGSSVMYVNDLRINQALLDEINLKIKNNNYNFYWGEIGPYLITDVFKNLDIFDSVKDKKLFFSIEPENFNLLFEKKSYQSVVYKLEGSFVCHTWNEMFRKFDINKTYTPPEGSYIYKHNLKFTTQSTNNTYGKLFNLRFNPIFKYLYKLSSRLKTFGR